MKKLVTLLILLLGLVGCVKDPHFPQEGVKPKNPFVMNSYFSDGMILQQNQPINVFGRSEKGVLIEVSLFKKDATTAIAKGKTFADDNGDWQVVLPAMSASFQLYKMIINDSVHTKEINDILIGEVWLTSGEKNMTWPVRYTKDASRYIIHNEYTKYIRYFTQDHYPNSDPGSNMSSEPQFDFSHGQWLMANSIKILDASGFSFVFACELFEGLNKGSAKVPVAFIESAVDESNIHAWLPKTAIDNNPYLKSQLEHNGFYPIIYNTESNQNYNQMSVLYNHKINPLSGINFKGVIWYQGTSDIDHYAYYNEALRTLIDSWRKQLSTDLAFLVVGEHSYQKENLALFRQAQILGTNFHSKVVLVPTFDIDFVFEYKEGYDMEPISESSPYYPINKIDVAVRVAKAALALVYKSNEKYFSPHLQNYTISLADNCITLYFANAKNLHIKNIIKDIDEDAEALKEEYDTINNLIIVLKDGTEVEAKVKVEDNKVMIYYENFKEVLAIKYAFLDEPDDSNLYNELDLPTLPFYLVLKWY